jgi:hypothetical protein
MAKLNIEMTYPVPDKYLSQSTAAGRTATLSYLGPDTIWVDVHKDGDRKGKWTSAPIKTNYHDDGDIEGTDDDMTVAIEALPVPLDAIRVKIDCTKDAHICSIWTDPHTVGDDRGSYDKLPQVQDKLADGTVYYERPADDKIPPDHIWNKNETTWNSKTKKWDLVLLKTWNSWENVRAVRNKLLAETDMKKMLPEGEEYDAWEAYRQELRDLPQKYDGKEPHTVPHPDSPEDTENKARQAAEENN